MSSLLENGLELVEFGRNLTDFCGRLLATTTPETQQGPRGEAPGSLLRLRVAPLAAPWRQAESQAKSLCEPRTWASCCAACGLASLRHSSQAEDVHTAYVSTLVKSCGLEKAWRSPCNLISFYFYTYSPGDSQLSLLSIHIFSIAFSERHVEVQGADTARPRSSDQTPTVTPMVAPVPG